MQVNQETAVTLLTELGHKTAKNLSPSRLLAKLQAIPEKLEDDDLEKVEDKAALKLLKAIHKDPSIVEDFELDSDAEANGEDAPAKKKAKGKPAKATKAAKAAKDEEEEEDDDSEEEEEEEEEADDDDDESEEEDSDEEEEEEDDDDEDDAPAKKKKGKATKAKKAGPKKAEGPGVIGSIQEFLEAASEDKPLSKDAIVAKLLKRFPDRNEESLGSTVAQQVPTKLRSQKGLNIQKNDKGYYLGAKKAKKAKA